jgi:hypothetical protein
MESDFLRPPAESAWCEIDINLAARYDGPVLISATPDDALAIARLIATLGRGGSPTQVLICDLAAGDDVMTAMADAALRQHLGSERLMLLLREVQALTPSDQTIVMKRLVDRQLRPFENTARIIASSSINLFQRVEQGTFDPRLFYRLNAIHIIGSNQAGTAQAD